MFFFGHWTLPFSTQQSFYWKLRLSMTCLQFDFVFLLLTTACAA